MLIAFSGLKNSGKDTAAKVLIDEYGFTKIAFADALREALLILNPWVPIYINGMTTWPLEDLITQEGWDWAKHNVPEVRRLMQVFGTEVGRMLLGENVWVDTVAKRFPDIADSETRYVITDCRFPNEADFVRNNGGVINWIERPGLISDGHASESTVMRDLASTIIHNDSTIEEFAEDVRLMLFMRRIDKV
jgi:hypothetical protein